MSVFHGEATSESWRGVWCRVDWPNRQLIATVTHFSLFTIGATCVGVGTVCYADGTGAAVISLKEPPGFDTLKVGDTGSGIQFSSALGSGSLSATEASITSLIINAGKSNVEINGNLASLGGTLEVDGSAIKVDSGPYTISAAGAINFNAIYQSNGHSVFGITTTILGVNAGIDLADTTLTGSSIDLQAFAGTLTTTVSDGGTHPASHTPHHG